MNTRTTLTSIAVAAVAFVGCTSSDGYVRDITDVEAEMDALEWSAPPFVDNDDGSFEACGIYYAEDFTVSTYQWTDYDEYCLTYLIGLTMRDDDVCDEWAATDDADIIDLFMTPAGGGHSYSGAVGLLDALWAVC